MDILETKILKAIGNNKLNPTIVGERKWYNYFISVSELVWERNLWDGYNINVYSDPNKAENLGNYWLGFDYCSKPFLKSHQY